MSYSKNNEIPRGFSVEEEALMAAGNSSFAANSSQASIAEMTQQPQDYEAIKAQQLPITEVNSTLASSTIESSTNQRWYSRSLTRSAFAVLAGAGAVGLGIHLQSEGSKSKRDPSVSYTTAVENCSKFTLSDKKYANPNEILPALSGVYNDNTASDYTKKLFSRGPLGNEVNIGILSATTSVLGGPAFNKQQEQNIGSAFDQVYAHLITSSKAIVKACAENQVTMGSTVSYEQNALIKGSLATQLIPKENSAGQIIGETINQSTASNNESGVVYDISNEANGAQHLNNFYPVLVTKQGTVYLLNYPKVNKTPTVEIPPTTTTPPSNQPQSSTSGATANAPGLGAGSTNQSLTIGGPMNEGKKCVVGEPCTPGAPAPASVSTPSEQSTTTTVEQPTPSEQSTTTTVEQPTPPEQPTTTTTVPSTTTTTTPSTAKAPDTTPGATGGTDPGTNNLGDPFGGS